MGEEIGPTGCSACIDGRLAELAEMEKEALKDVLLAEEDMKAHRARLNSIRGGIIELRRLMELGNHVDNRERDT